jgi:Zn-finger nucleic acid-binding protein
MRPTPSLARSTRARSVARSPLSSRLQTIVQREIVQRVVTVDTSGRTSLPCPRCDGDVALFEGKSGDTLLHGCGTCGGVWLDNQASRRIVNAIPPGIIDMTERAARAASAPNIDAAQAAKAARCPFDRNELARANVKGVVIDACATHGTWFDAGEVTLLSHAFERARQAHAGGAAYSYASAARNARENLDTLSSILSALSTSSR